MYNDEFLHQPGGIDERIRKDIGGHQIGSLYPNN